ncbi:MAG: hypothetical protein II330_08480 [Clostridia bacterium]|nr:hypothetical protein [Clostridia bacterium]MBQ2256887.1 hypothetical protein [Clostridia bacterium]
MKKFKKINLCITAGAMAFLLCVLAVMPVFSMGFMAVPGALCYGTAPFSEHSVIELEYLHVNVDIPNTPNNLYENEQGMWEHNTPILSVYSLYNPTAERVTEVMAIPFGMQPDYSYDEHNTSPVLPYEGAYEILFKGKSITPVVRHTLSEHSLRNDQFEVMDESAWRKVYPMHDEKMTDELYYPEQKVTVHTYVVSNPSNLEGGDFFLLAELGAVDVASTRLYTDNGGEYYGKMRSYASQDAAVFHVYVIGEDVGELAWQAVTWDSDKRPIESVSVSLQSKTESTFEQIAMEYYTPDCGASEVDWYNAVYAFFATGSTRCGVVDKFEPSSHDIRNHLQGWLLYEITLDPYEHAELKTQTPAFPDIINRCEPNIFEYGYDLAGLSHFAKVGQVKLTVNTHLYTLDNSSYYHTYQVPVGEYSLTIDDLTFDKSAKRLITFSVCEEQNPTDIPSIMVYGGLALVVLVGLAVLAWWGSIIVGLIVLVCVIIRKIKHRNVKQRKITKYEDRIE